MHEKEHLCAIRPMKNAWLETMHFAAEVVPIKGDRCHPRGQKKKSATASLKQRNSLSNRFRRNSIPGKYRDEYKDCVMKLVNQKAKGEEIHVQPVIEKKSAKSTDLIAALEQSLAHAKAVSQNGKRRKSA